MSRKCANNCFNEACSPTGRSWFQKLCRECCAKRRAKSAKSKAQPKCRCGGCLPLGANLCRGCQGKADARREEFVRNAENLRLYYEHGVVPL